MANAEFWQLAMQAGQALKERRKKTETMSDNETQPPKDGDAPPHDPIDRTPETAARRLALLDELFRFKIGDEVVMRTDADHWRMYLEVHGPTEGSPSYGVLRNVLPSSRVLEQLAQRCHGGCQLHYKLRRYAKDGTTVVDTVSEFELVSRDEALAIMRAQFPETGKVESQIAHLEALEQRIERLRARAENREAAAKKSETP